MTRSHVLGAGGERRHAFGAPLPAAGHGELLASMKTCLVVVLAVLASGAEAAASCAADGEPVQWVADYCMLQMETDDEVAVSECIEKERKVRFADDCASNLHFKRRMCQLMIRNGTRAGSLDMCIDDRAFKGSTVEAGGVGGYPGR